jgi:hypothetical protein
MRATAHAPTLAFAVAGSLAVLIAAASPPLRAEVEITPSASGIAGGAVPTRQGDLTLDPGFAAGLSVGWRVRNDGLIEIAYSRQATAIDLDSRRLFDATLDYLHAGGVWEIRDGVTRPFIGLALGASRVEPDVRGIDAEWLFSAALYGGMKHWFSERIGLRVEGRGMLHAAASGGGFFCSSAGGGASCAATLSGNGFGQVQGLVGLIFRP